MPPRLSCPRTTTRLLVTWPRLPRNATRAPPMPPRISHTDDLTAPHYTSTRALDHNTATYLATMPLLPTKQLPAPTFMPSHHTTCTLLCVEDLVSGDNYLVDSESKGSCLRDMPSKSSRKESHQKGKWQLDHSERAEV
ncbi:hypothetical protein Pcinc_009256 [Petrolisthes cinctipes]|uniref:Uncharacterized protein n=1 Tax=Petrolisthes cinctipes TaxID=88211 RepID=A0AAE1G7C1_PETCI|nr:hypothetical protein Pcinc_009256 [Petrolisthes cinctipes]